MVKTLFTKNGKFKVDIKLSESFENPFTDWDGTIPIIVKSDRYVSKEYQYKEIIEFLSEKLDLSNCDLNDFNVIVDLCKKANLNYSLHSSKGYSQGDFVEVLFVITDKFLKETGLSFEETLRENFFDPSQDLFDDWAWGNIYEFILYEKKEFKKVYPDGKIVESFEWDQIDSCGGFYGENIDENGIMDHLPEEIRDDGLEICA